MTAQVLLFAGGAVAAIYVVFIVVRSAYVLWFLAIGTMGCSYYGLEYASATLHPEQIALLFVLGRALVVHREGGKAVLRGLGWGVVPWLGILVLSSVFFAPSSGSSLYIVAWITTGVAFGLIIFRYFKDEALVIVRAGSAALGTLSALSLVAYGIAPFVALSVPLARVNTGETVYRVGGLALEPNLYGSLCAVWLCVMVAWRPQLHRGYWFAAAVIAVAGLLTLTRSVWLSMVVIFVVLFVGQSSRRAGRLLVAALALVLLALIIPLVELLPAGVLPPEITERLVDFGNFSSGTGAFRANSWRIALADLGQGQAWLHGFGANSFVQFHNYAVRSKAADYLSNAWLAQLYDGGLFALLALVTYLIFQARRMKPLNAVAIMATIGLCASLTNPLWFSYPWVAIALIQLSDDASASRWTALPSRLRW